MSGEGKTIIDISIKIKDTTDVPEGHYIGIWGPSTYGKTIKEQGKEKILNAIAKKLDGLQDGKVYTFEINGLN